MSFDLTQHRRKKRIIARQAQILEAAATVFSRKGYERATTREIADEAGVSEGTLYNYFGSKKDLLIGVATEYSEQVAGAITTLEADNMEDMIGQLLTQRFRGGRERRLFMLFLSEARLNPDVHQYYVQEALSKIVQALEQHLQTLIEAGRMRSIDPAITARTLTATIMGFAALFELGGTFWAGLPQEADGKFSAEQLGQDVGDIFLHGILKE